ncbi:hypothetical protein BJY52DRAFT_1351176 [Lactarius psammicola]|nr:hypothetical protein BJY52DRAFT_1351176 [Lactarius psammicola]
MKPYSKCAKRKTKRHKSPLQQLADAYKADPKDFETIPAIGRNLATIEKRPFRTEIPKDKEESKRTDTHAPEHLKIYTDGSAHDGKVGAAAVMMKGDKITEKLHCHLGSTEKHTVFEAELTGILLGLQLIKNHEERNKTFALGVDNQAAIKALASKLNKSGHYLAAEALNAAARLKKTKGKKYALTIRWVAGHSEIPGNEKADEEAKKAAEGTTSEAAKLPAILRKDIKINRSAAKQHSNTKRKHKWKKEWEASPRYEKNKRLDPSLPSKNSSAHPPDDLVDVFDGYSFKGRHSVIIDGEEETFEEVEEEEDANVTGPSILAELNGEAAAETVVLGHEEPIPEPETLEARPTVLPPPSTPLPSGALCPLGPNFLLSTQPLNRLHSPTLLHARAKMLSALHLLYPDPPTDANEDDVRTERDDDDEWDFIEADGEERNGARGTSLFARGVVDRYRLAVFRNGSTPNRLTPSDAAARLSATTNGSSSPNVPARQVVTIDIGTVIAVSGEIIHDERAFGKRDGTDDIGAAERAHDACSAVAQVEGVVGRLGWEPGLVERRVDE